MKTASRLPFRWGVVGAGTIARQFVDDLGHLPDARVVAVHSRTRNSAQALAADRSAVSIHDEFEAMLDDESVDAVYIATPNSFHAPQALKALAAGKPVLVEKPLAMTSAQAREIFTASGRAGVFAMEALWSRFLPAVGQVRKLLAEGAIGKVQRVAAELAFHKPEVSGNRFYDPALGGGAARDLGVYPLSLAFLLFGRPTTVAGKWRAAGTGVDRRTAFDFEFDGGVKATLACGFDRDGDNAFMIFGSKGAIRIAPPFLKAQRVITYRGIAGDLPLVGACARASGTMAKVLARLPVPGRRVELFPFPGNGLQFQAAAVAEAVSGGMMQSEVMPLQDSIAVLETIESVLRQPPEG
ncbi:putative dehydrogenase [Pseudaminobacter salicylatoxidans]|uniref:Putative dehydrogenase n=1 Tax=Pseudaminobacter salicylatoxidans TaxID=93369 RepID=A0A316BW55_PSESE|nr:Gfo/Idh/MocA family oxidoreductase [Pseudaminobacter salicylatoxidans]PWJ77641.1 putative dehydrogenase [Pseudaminobacter salicylatoxidans]